MTTRTKLALAAVERAMQPVRLRAVGYLRVSTEEQTKGYGIAYTKKKVMRHSEAKGWEYVDTYADEGYSGSLDHTRRPHLKRLMADAHRKPRPFDVVVVPEERAIGRRDRAFWPWVWKLEDLGIFVAVVRGDYDNTTEEGRKRMRDEASRAEEERIIIRDRTQGGLQEHVELLAEEGVYPGGKVPYGWRIEYAGQKGMARYVVDGCNCVGQCHAVHEAVVARRARELYVVRPDWQATALRLSAEGLFDRSGKPWERRNLQNRIMGRALTENIVIWRGGPQTARRQDGATVHGEPVVIHLPPVFTPEQIKELREAAKTRTRPRKRGVRTYILTKRIASPCGRHYAGGSHRGVASYTCSGRREKYAGAGEQCSCPSLDADATEAQIWERVRGALSDAEKMKAMIEQWRLEGAGEAVDYTRRIAELDQRIAEQSGVVDVTMAVAARQAARRGLRGAQAEEAVERAVAALNEELEALERDRAKALAWQQEASSLEQRLSDFERLAEMAGERMDALTPEGRLELVTLLELQATLVQAPTPPGRGRRRGAVEGWFFAHGRTVPVLTDDGWRLVQPLLASRHAAIDRRTAMEGFLLKARTGVRWEELPPECGHSRALRTLWHRWVNLGLWEAAMDLLADQEQVPVYAAEPPAFAVTLRPLALGTDSSESALDGTVLFHDPALELTLTLTA